MPTINWKLALLVCLQCWFWSPRVENRNDVNKRSRRQAFRAIVSHTKHKRTSNTTFHLKNRIGIFYREKRFRAARTNTNFNYVTWNRTSDLNTTYVAFVVLFVKRWKIIMAKKLWFDFLRVTCSRKSFRKQFEKESNYSDFYAIEKNRISRQN